MIKEVDFQKTTEDAFLKYAASVAQERAIPDVRDMLKIGLRQGLYAQYTNKLTSGDKFQKAQKSVAAAMTQSYVHGDAAMYDTLIRAARPWSTHYPLEEVQGQYGNPSSPDSHAAARYVEMRASKIADYMFAGLKKNAITEWYDNYDDTEKIPSVFPSIGYWNIVNGCSGIAVAMATSVPQFNLKEVNAALIKLIENPHASFDEIYCAPDFATGGLITNKSEVKESLRLGKGKSIRLRATLKYNPAENSIIATEIPYGVFTDTIMGQLAEIVENNPDYGIENAHDYTKKKAEIHIRLTKGVNPQKMMAKLYHDTSLENWFSINMVLLDKGRFPKIFGWREACNAYIEHIRECERNIIQWELDKALARENVVNGLLLAAANIDEVVAIIRSSDNPSQAGERLIARFGFNEPQVKAILSMKLSSLTRIDSIKLNEERAELERKIIELNYLLSEPTALDKKLIELLNEVATTFGDTRRTQLEDSLKEEEEPEPIIEEDVRIIWSGNTIRLTKSKAARKGKEIFSTTLGTLILITDAGKFYTSALSKLEFDKDYKVSDIFECGTEKSLLIEDINKFNAYSTLTCVTKNGLIKKSRTFEYLTRSKKGSAAIKLEDGDKLIAAILSSNDNERIVIKGSTHYNCYPLTELNNTGRVTKGVKAIKLNDGENVKEAFIAVDNSWTTTNRAVKGIKY